MNILYREYFELAFQRSKLSFCVLLHFRAYICLSCAGRKMLKWQVKRKIVERAFLTGFLITLSPIRPFASNSFFFISKVAIIKTKSVTLLFFFSSLFLFLLSFSFVTVILELLALKKLAFWRLFTQMTANFVRLVFKKSATFTWQGTAKNRN